MGSSSSEHSADALPGFLVMGLSMPVLVASSVGAAVARLAPFWA